MAAERIDLLRQMPAFGGLTQESLELILRESAEVIAATGDVFFHEGDPGDSLFVLESGAAVVERNWDGETIVLGTLGQGDCFGEMSLIDFQPRSATVRAESNSQAIEVPSRALRVLYKHDVEQYAMIMMNLGREVSRRLRLADECLFRLQQTPHMP